MVERAGVARRDPPDVALVGPAQPVDPGSAEQGARQQPCESDDEHVLARPALRRLNRKESHPVERAGVRPADGPRVGGVGGNQAVVAAASGDMAGDLPRRPEDEGVGLRAADEVLDAAERDQVDRAGVRIGDGPRIARRRADQSVDAAAADDRADAGDAASARGRANRQVDGHGEGGRGVVECVHTAPAVDPTGHAAAGKDEAVAVLPTDEVLDASERLTIERTGADTGEGPGVRGVGADQGVIAEAAGNDTAQAAASGPYKGIGGGPAREVLDAGERLAVESAGGGAVDGPGGGRVGADLRG